MQKNCHKQAEGELAYAKKHNLTAIASTDPDYPPLLGEMADYPHVIYVLGNVEALKMRTVSMVGTRTISPYGQTMCERLVRGLSERVPGVCVVSGLAFGIDAACHRAAMRYGAATVAAVANALPEITPASNAGLGRDIVESGGAIVTELHSNSKQTGDFYIPRNRIIAGLSSGTVVVEAAHGSGALTTADFAVGYNRTVMAVPGRATDSVAWGCNSLIKSQKAAMVCTAEDIIRAIGWDFEHADVGELSHCEPAISAAQKGLLGCFKSGEATSVDTLCELTALSYNTLAPMLLELEFAGKIQRLPSGFYERVS